MEPCPGKPGVIFSSDELPHVAEILEVHVDDASIMHTAGVGKVLHDLRTAHHPKYGYCGGAFVPADEALVVSRLLREAIDKADINPIVVNIGPFTVAHVAISPDARFKNSLANQIEQNVDKSRRLTR